MDRVLIIAPHPDDETIGAGALIQRTIASGGNVRAVFITDGENNLWPQRITMKKWRITNDDRAAWGTTRRDEARAALVRLGATAESAIFLNYPDRALLAYAKKGNDAVTEALRSIVTDFDPTLIVSPSILDLHADHRGAALFTHYAAPQRTIVTYIVHGSGNPDRVAMRIEPTPEERARKRAAIECHETQLHLSRERFLSYADSNEVFYRAEHDILRVDSLYWKWRCKTLHGWRVLTSKGGSKDER